jgi:serine/threonine protein kinase
MLGERAMSEQVIQCAWCDRAHPANETVCPTTGLTLRSVATHDDALAEFIGKSVDGRYLVRSVLGEGGMGMVFEAEHLKIGRAVALKVLHERQARNKSAVRRFYREAKAAAAIGHPNICEVYDFGTLVDGRPYLVMERLNGETLAERIAKDAVLQFDEVIDILTQVLSGLAAAHEKGIVHRDIKPENVFLSRRSGAPPMVKLLDFGISKVIAPERKGDEMDLTRPGMVMGTPHYMSPEQARGERDLDARVDLYACGVILYEALTGCRPFTAPNYDALLLHILSSKPRSARELRPALPVGFDPVIEMAMAPARDQRYRSADEFARDLEAVRAEWSHAGLAGYAGTRVLADVTERALIPTPPPSSVEIPVTFVADMTDTPTTQYVARTDANEAPAQRYGEVDDSPTMEQTSPFALAGESGAYTPLDVEGPGEGEPAKPTPRAGEGGPTGARATRRAPLDES